MAHDEQGGLATEAELFFMQIGLDLRERGHLLALGHDVNLVAPTPPAPSSQPPIVLRVSDSSSARR
jgi:hypothetical protein